MPRPVPVAHVIHGFELGGLERLVLELCVLGREQGINPCAIVLGPDGPMLPAFESAQIPLFRIAAPGMSLAALAGIRHAVGRWGANVVHAHDLGPWLNSVASRAARPSTRVIATFHEQRIPTGALRRASSVAARFSYALVACGKQVRDNIQGWAPPGTRVVLIENGVRLPAPATEEDRCVGRERLGIPLDAIAIGYLGRLEEIKGSDLLLDAFLSRFANRGDVHLALVGSGSLEPELRRRAAGKSNIHFTGPVLDAARLLPGFDVYAQTSRSEGRSLSMLEAMAAGLPTVASALDPVRELHRDGETALLAPAGDSAAIAQALDRLCSDGRLRAQLGTRARDAAREHSIESAVEAYVGLYREVARRSRAA